jgi:hydrogenase maturation factor
MHAELSAHGGSGQYCITCGDEATPMRVIRVDAAERLALCEDELGTEATIQIDLVDDLSEGDTVLTHAGVALTRLERRAA